MKKSIVALILAVMVLGAGKGSQADEFEFAQVEHEFKNFLTCELTRTGAANHFEGKPFEITMIDLFDIQNEGELTIITGAVQCSVEKKYHTLYAAVGVKKIMDVDQVLYYVVRKNDFRILSTELIRHPYKERCRWTSYFIDID